MYFTTRDSKANYTALGKGWIAGACDELKKYHRAMIMEYQNDDITFARVSISLFYKNIIYCNSDKIPN